MSGPRVTAQGQGVAAKVGAHQGVWLGAFFGFLSPSPSPPAHG